jgi:hypothetical protein
MKRRSAQTSGRIGRLGNQRVCRRGSIACRNFGGRGLRNSNSFIEIQMFLGAAGTVAFARIFVAQTGQFITPVDTVAVARHRCCFDGNQSHACLALRIRRKIVHFSGALRKEGSRGQTRTAEVASRKCCCALSRNSSQIDSGSERNTSTTFGSNCVPLQRFTSLRACSTPKALR